MIRAIVTDIEGTTSDIRFVHDVLFPYARKHLPDFLRQHENEPAVRHAVDAVRQETGQPEATTEQVITALLGFMDEDRKSTPLKALQGMIWQTGYQNGDFTGHLYPDVLPCLMAWRQQGIALYVYSSGSVAAQKLLFGYSDHGDITPLFSGYFDTHVGHKRETVAYQNIAAAIGFSPDELLFLSDIHQELDAAQLAGWHTVQLIRGSSDGDSRHPQVTHFTAIQPEAFPQ